MQLLETLCYILIGYEHIYCRHLYILMCIRRRVRECRLDKLVT